MPKGGTQMCSGAKKYVQLEAYHDKIVKEIMRLVKQGPWKKGEQAIKFIISQMANSEEVSWEDALKKWAEENQISETDELQYALLKNDLSICLSHNRYETIALLCKIVA